MMQAYEKLGAFYLGRPHDLATGKTLREPFLYPSRDLLTHALCVGMTGSGKTGLCLSLIEEAAIDGVPAILIDPKGDLTNLLLTFPELGPGDFEPWVDPTEADRRGLSLSAYAEQQARLWKEGLAAWDQDGDRIRRMRAAAEFAIYTPGSQAGLPISILRSLGVPPPHILEDPEWCQERIATTVNGLLGLVGIEVEAGRGREAVFLSNLLHHAWQAGRDLDLPQFLEAIQSPGFSRIGVLELESFYPARDRFQLAAAVNALLASPGFGAWLEGESLDVEQMCHTPQGRPRVTIFSIAHLQEAQRMFFVTVLLTEVLGWMRRQPGTGSLRALFYMDEIHGYFPPVSNPPSKPPLLTLLKQARAFGLGVVLATQNPMDLDYKGLANIGTWFIGRLQTDRDRQRLMDGLEGASAGGAPVDRGALERSLAALAGRVFLMRNVHDEELVVFESRWAMSYLRGPLTREQIRSLVRSRPGEQLSGGKAGPSGAPGARATGRAADDGEVSAVTSRPAAAAWLSTRPVLPPAIRQHFLPTTKPGLVYEARVVGAADVRWSGAAVPAGFGRTVLLLASIVDGAVPVDWSKARTVDLQLEQLRDDPAQGALYVPPPPAAAQVKNYAVWERELVQFLQTSQTITLLKSPHLGLVSRPDEDERAFRIRLILAARERRDGLVAKLRARYTPRLEVLQERLRRARQAVERETSQARQAKLSSALSIGSTVLGALFGRRTASVANLRRAGSAMRSVGRAADQSADVTRAGETVEAVERQLADLNAEFEAETRAAEGGFDPLTEVLEPIVIRPARSGINLRLVALAWVPS